MSSERFWLADESWTESLFHFSESWRPLCPFLKWTQIWAVWFQPSTTCTHELLWPVEQVWFNDQRWGCFKWCGVFIGIVCIVCAGLSGILVIWSFCRNLHVCQMLYESPAASLQNNSERKTPTLFIAQRRGLSEPEKSKSNAKKLKFIELEWNMSVANTNHVQFVGVVSFIPT